MKPCNFPARKLIRQIAAKHGSPFEGFNDAEQSAINQARLIRTKKDRRGQGRIQH